MDTTNLGSLGDLIVWLLSLGAASIAYGKVVGSYQVRLTEIVITTLAVRSRWKPLANLLTGIAPRSPRSARLPTQLDSGN